MKWGCDAAPPPGGSAGHWFLIYQRIIKSFKVIFARLLKKKLKEKKAEHELIHMNENSSMKHWLFFSDN